MLVIVGLAEPPAVANDRVVLAERAQPRQEMQRHYPGSMLSLVSGSAIRRITAGVEARRDRRLLSFDLLVGPSPSRHSRHSNEKRILLSAAPRESSTRNIGRL